MKALKALAIVVGLVIVLFIAVAFFGEAGMKMDAIAANELAARVQQAIKERNLIVGMTPEDAVKSWGEPKRKTVSGGAGGSREQWVYEGTYVYFREGRLVSWSQTR